MKSIQMTDLISQYERIQEEIDDAVLRVIRSGRYINGEEVQLFASELSKLTGAKQVIPCANGTDALQIALMALDLQEGDEVIVPAFTYAATVEAVALLRLVPVAVDVDPLTFNMDVRKIEEAISPRTKAILPVHLFGQSADMEPVMQIARKWGLYVVEDNAQSICADYTFSDGSRKQTGTMGDIGTLSFFPSKNLGCYGDGGALLTNRDDLAEKLRQIASHGQSQKYIHERIGCNSRLDTLQAAVLRVKLPHLPAYIHARRKAAKEYDAALLSANGLFEIPYCIPQSNPVYHQYTIKVNNGKRDDLQNYLKKKGIPTMVYYPRPLQRQPAFRNILKTRGDLSVTDQLCTSVLSLPIHTELEEAQLDYIICQLIAYGKTNS
ncbi:MAG: DegT/DnrJ/EryC1/StrS family aminotransferase [Candidatus Azobacteroides sp.]|nr:DegT/DnrJ/EryC1/StrS family aminotransferase [Candidatus Azobacteroides sp.]